MGGGGGTLASLLDVPSLSLFPPPTIIRALFPTVAMKSKQLHRSSPPSAARIRTEVELRAAAAAPADVRCKSVEKPSVSFSSLCVYFQQLSVGTKGLCRCSAAKRQREGFQPLLVRLLTSRQHIWSGKCSENQRSFLKSTCSSLQLPLFESFATFSA